MPRNRGVGPPRRLSHSREVSEVELGATLRLRAIDPRAHHLRLALIGGGGPVGVGALHRPLWRSRVRDARIVASLLAFV